ncbi:hypothetical protein [Mycoplasma seminis]|uniref:Yip1 domain-containing protein n=1 Tax=Mycoplasma seminis TaxID=512749 RepID=A0ABY9HAN8_9MOLU|nr:hypothetical protein [Mycoplasma seminis]WLP85657.1 hypothetical protein Q8852_00650 [Mycoplasma seminis]
MFEKIFKIGKKQQFSKYQFVANIISLIFAGISLVSWFVALGYNVNIINNTGEYHNIDNYGTLICLFMVLIGIISTIIFASLYFKFGNIDKKWVIFISTASALISISFILYAPILSWDMNSKAINNGKITLVDALFLFWSSFSFEVSISFWVSYFSLIVAYIFRSSNREVLWIILLPILVVIGLVVAILLIMGGKKDSSSRSNSHYAPNCREHHCDKCHSYIKYKLQKNQKPKVPYWKVDEYYMDK